MPIISQNNSLLSNAAASILGGKQIVSLDNTDDIRATAVAYVDVIAPFCGDAASKEIEKAITASDKTIKTVFVNGVTFEFGVKTFAVYIVNSYDLSQLQNFYGDVNGAELPSGYFVVVVPVGEVKADALKGNVGQAEAPGVLNVETGKAIKESTVTERTTSVTYAQAISALAGSAEDEDISVLKRYADCVSIIFGMTAKEVMKDLLP